MLRFGVHEEQPVFRGKLFGLSTKKKTRTNIFSAVKTRACLRCRNVVKFTVARSEQCQEKISLAKMRPSFRCVYSSPVSCSSRRLYSCWGKVSRQQRFRKRPQDAAGLYVLCTRAWLARLFLLRPDLVSYVRVSGGSTAIVAWVRFYYCSVVTARSPGEETWRAALLHRATSCSTFPLRCPTMRWTIRSFAQWNLILVYLQHSKFNIVYILHITLPCLETRHLLCVSTWLRSCMLTI